LMARAKPQNTKKSNFHKETKLQSEVKIKVKPALLQYSNVHVRVLHAVYCMQCVVTRDAFIIAH